MKFSYVPLNNTIVIDNIIYKCVENQPCLMCDFYINVLKEKDLILYVVNQKDLMVNLLYL